MSGTEPSSPQPDESEQHQQRSSVPPPERRDGTPGASPLIKWLVIGVVVVVVGAGTWYIWGYFSAKGQIRAINDALGTTYEAPANPGATDPGAHERHSDVDGTKIDIATYPHNGNSTENIPAFHDLPLGAQIDAVAPYVNEHVQQWWTDYLAELQKPENRGQNFQIGDDILAPVGPNNDAQTITNRSTAILQHIVYDSDNHNSAKNLVSAKNLPGTESYNDSISLITEKKSTYLSPVGVYDELPAFTDGSFASIEANGTPTKVFVVYDYDTDKTFINVFQLVEGSKTGEKTWILVDQDSIRSSMGRAYAELPNTKPIPAEAK